MIIYRGGFVGSGAAGRVGANGNKGNFGTSLSPGSIPAPGGRGELRTLAASMSLIDFFREILTVHNPVIIVSRQSCMNNLGSETQAKSCHMSTGSFGGNGQLATGSMGFSGDDMATRLQQQTMQMQQVSVVLYESLL